MRSHALLRALHALGLPPGDFAVFGSGPLFAAGLIDTMHDLDVLARGAAWTYACRLGSPRVPASGVGEVVELPESGIEVFSDWSAGPWDIDTLIDTAEMREGLPFVRVVHVLEWKRRMGRPKDLAFLASLREAPPER